MAFPTSPTNGDLHSEFGRSYQYVADTSSWRAATSPAPEITISTVTAFESAVDLPLVNNNPGDTTFIAADNSFRLWTGSGWFEIALVNTAPTITTGANATYALNSDGTPTIITMAATDPEGTPVVWGYLVTSGSLEDTTVTNVDNVFTITPGTIAATFDLSFTASDGINIDTSASSFTLAFVQYLTPTFTLDNPNPIGTSTIDYFSNAMAASANYALVGAYGERASSDNTLNDSGMVYVFNISTGALIRTLENPNAYGSPHQDRFGQSGIAVSGNYAIIGVPGEDDAGDGGGVNSGKVYIFNISTGALIRTLDNPNAYYTSAGDSFGASVGISGDYVVISSPFEDDAGGTNSGKVYIFSISSGALLFTINNPNPYGTSLNDRFGEGGVSVSGNYAIVGAIYEDDAVGDSTGKAYIFNITNGALVYTLNNPNAYGTSAADGFGGKVDISGNYAIVSAVNEADAGGTNSGKVYIFKTNTGNWSDTTLLHTLDNPNANGTSETDLFGISIAMSGTYLVVGAGAEDDGVTDDQAGKAYIFNSVTGELVYVLNNPNAYGTTDGDRFGQTVAISGNNVVVGALYEDDANGTFSGKAYIFQIT